MVSLQKLRQKGIVVFIDVLGTKGSWKDNPEATISMWEEFNDTFEEFLKLGLPYKYSMISFSDTIIVTASDENIDDLLLHTGKFMITPLRQAIINNIFFRGCISVGTFYQSKTMIMGPAIDEAVEYSKITEWVGISAAPSANEMLNSMGKSKTYDSAFTQYDIPTKIGVEKNGWALNWPLADALRAMSDSGKCLESVKRKLKEHTDPRIAFKYRNTLDFYNKARKYGSFTP